ncbi:hypothetical protein PY254_11105 [Rhodanobacter sp. AS-Z3]|uniref:hypothetical protein n=1 Tax=Rhodanobacter sp. AS-Z3 TaxID=3031330 RepID=UPI00247AF402|nr:hypothetical protein [Rhodanobacter sp. AS-Z3]WEN13793.1 hypothetical protein PY254_11105 [Rhodanobacter sp. AS-Z3]
MTVSSSFEGLEERILYSSKSSAEVAQLLNFSPSRTFSLRSWVGNMRRLHKLWGVWSAEDRVFVYPAFQFNQRGTLPRLQEMLRPLDDWVGRGPYALSDEDGWQRTIWLYRPNDYFASMQNDKNVTEPPTPAQMFANDPELVIRLVEGIAVTVW